MHSEHGDGLHWLSCCVGTREVQRWTLTHRYTTREKKERQKKKNSELRKDDFVCVSVSKRAESQVEAMGWEQRNTLETMRILSNMKTEEKFQSCFNRAVRLNTNFPDFFLNFPSSLPKATIYRYKTIQCFYTMTDRSRQMEPMLTQPSMGFKLQYICFLHPFVENIECWSFSLNEVLACGSSLHLNW